MIVAAVPVKDLANAKQRLVRALAPEERVALAGAMLRDVLRALRRARLDAVWVVTRDREVSAIAGVLGIETLTEADNRGHSAAVAFAQRAAHERDARVFVTVPGDVPCVTADEIDALVVAAQAPPAAVFVPSRSCLGTNGVALAPPEAMPLTFGEPSFTNHLTTARAHGLEPRVLTLPGVGLDVDDSDDLNALAARGAHTESGKLVARLFERRLRRRNGLRGEASEGAFEAPSEI